MHGRLAAKDSDPANVGIRRFHLGDESPDLVHAHRAALNKIKGAELRALVARDAVPIARQEDLQLQGFIEPELRFVRWCFVPFRHSIRLRVSELENSCSEHGHSKLCERLPNTADRPSGLLTKFADGSGVELGQLASKTSLDVLDGR